MFFFGRIDANLGAADAFVSTKDTVALWSRIIGNRIFTNGVLPFVKTMDKTSEMCVCLTGELASSSNRVFVDFVLNPLRFWTLNPDGTARRTSGFYNEIFFFFFEIFISTGVTIIAYGRRVHNSSYLGDLRGTTVGRHSIMCCALFKRVAALKDRVYIHLYRMQKLLTR